MNEGATFAVQLRGILFVILAVLCVFGPLLPLEFEAEARVLPDFLFVLMAAWILRRPESTPLIILALIFMIADFALGRPAGLWALIMLLSSEVLRTQLVRLRDQPFVFEWLNFAIVLGIALLAQALILTITIVPQPSAGRMMQLYIGSVVIYPAVVILLHWIFRIRAPKPEERSMRLGRVA